jgi:hypothetical protein
MIKMRTILALVMGISLLIFVGCNETKKTSDVPKPAASEQVQKPQGQVKGDVSEKDHETMNKLQELVK